MSKSKKKSRLSPFTKFYLILILSTIPGGKACNGRRMGENFGQQAAAEISNATRQASDKISKSMEESTKRLQESIASASKALEIAAGQLSKSIDNGAKELGSSIRQVSGDLVKISEKVTNSFDKGVEEMSSVMREAINATKEISQTLSNTVDKAVAEVGKQIEHATNKVQEIVKDLTDSLDKAMDKLAETMMHVADSLVEISKQVNLRIDSGDMVELGKEVKEGLVQSIAELTQNWEMAVNTADLKDVGASAAAELSKALQNINAKVVVRMEIDDNSRRAIKYISFAVGTAFSVLFIAIIVTLKSCRSCVVNSFTAITKCKSSDVEASAVEDGVKNKVELKPLKKQNLVNNKPLKKQAKVEFSGDNGSSSNTDYKTDDDNDDGMKDRSRKKKAFDKRLTKSYSDYKNFPKIKNQWEKRENRALDQNSQSSNLDKLLSPD